MERFYQDLKKVLEDYNNDVAALDDYEVDQEFIRSIIENHFKKENTQILSINSVHVFDGPNLSSLSITLSIRFEMKILPDYNIEETKNMSVFVKLPVFEDENKASKRLCLKEIKVYEDYFCDLKAFHDHPIKGPYTPPIPSVFYISQDPTNVLLGNKIWYLDLNRFILIIDYK